MKSKLATLLAGLLLLAVPLSAQAQNKYTEVDLVSDVSGRAARTDANLVNPWGIVPGSSGVFWVANNGTSTSTLYQPDGTPVPLVVNVPGGGPTGVVLGNASDLRFGIPSGDTTASAVFIFVSVGGVISAWSPVVDNDDAIQVASTSGAVYTGAALASTTNGPRLYAANFSGSRIDVFGADFAPVTPSGSFTDPNLPEGYSPFNVANINGQLYVAYAQAEGDEEVKGPGLGYVDVYDTDGNLLRRFTSGDVLNAPWGMVLAPGSFGPFSNMLLVGNLGDGRINAFAVSDGSFQGTLANSIGDPIELEGLWGLSFGSAASGSTVASRLYFAAGIEDETHGLFGYLRVAADTDTVVTPPPGGGGETCDNHSRGLGFWSKACGTHPNNGHGNGQGQGQGQDHGRGMGFPDANSHGQGLGRPGNGHGADSDSLDAMFSCISSSIGAFGGSGCFTAGCDLLGARGQRSMKDKVAQHFLVLLLNRCGGFICDANPVSCDENDADEDGEDDNLSTVGEVITFVDQHLCSGDLSNDQLENLKDLIECALGSGDGEDDDEGEDLRHDALGSHQIARGGLQVKTLSGNPLRPAAGVEARLQVSSDHPMMVRLGIYDAQGRLVAHLLRDVAVAGQVEVRWNGRNLSGDRVPAGTYFYRATGPNTIARGRIVVLQ